LFEESTQIFDNLHGDNNIIDDVNDNNKMYYNGYDDDDDIVVDDDIPKNSISILKTDFGRNYDSNKYTNTNVNLAAPKKIKINPFLPIEKVYNCILKKPCLNTPISFNLKLGKIKYKNFQAEITDNQYVYDRQYNKIFESSVEWIKYLDQELGKIK
jgi:hypothetical protein